MPELEVSYVTDPSNSRSSLMIDNGYHSSYSLAQFLGEPTG